MAKTFVQKLAALAERGLRKGNARRPTLLLYRALAAFAVVNVMAGTLYTLSFVSLGANPRLPNWILMFAGILLLLAGILMAAATRLVSKAQLVSTDAGSAEAEGLQRTELFAALDAGKMAVWDWHLPTDKLSLSDTWFSLLGYKKGELKSDWSTWAALLHPDDLFDKTVFLKKGGDKAGSRQRQYRMRDSSGRYRWIRCVTRRVPGSRGKVERIVGIHQDITDQICVDIHSGVPNEQSLQLWSDSFRKKTSGKYANRFAMTLQMTSGGTADVFRGGERFAGLVGEIYKSLKSVLASTSDLGNFAVGCSRNEAFLICGESSLVNVVTGTLLPELTAALEAEYNKKFPGYVFSSAAGISFASSYEDSPAQLLDQARVACEHHCRDRQGLFCQWQQDLLDEVQANQKLAEDLLRAAKAGEFEPYVQPIIRADDESVAGYELLCRWNHPEFGFVSPEKFIPIATEQGVLPEITTGLTEKALKNLVPLIKERKNGDRIFLSINLTATLFSDEKWLWTYLEFLEAVAQQLPIHYHFEITENEFAGAAPAFRRGLSHARAAGIKISLDDFGTGYSNLAYLTSLPIDIIKIDRSFFVALDGENSKDAMSLLEGIVSLSKSLDHVIIAEGIETDLQADTARRLGCELLQGYRYGRPQPVQT